LSNLRANIAPDMSPIFTANRPPKPQQSSAPGSSTSSASVQRLVGHPFTAQSVARGVVSQPTGKAGACVGLAQHIDQKLAELVNTTGQRLGARPINRISREEFRIVMLNHIGARAGGNDYWIVMLAQHVQGVAGHGPRVVPEAAVEGGLAAAGQPIRDGDRHSQALQHLGNRQTNVRCQGFDNACSE
jgi:hypothetical protein